LKLNIIGLISAILAFIAIVLPWYTVTYIVSFNFSLVDFANLAGYIGPLAREIQAAIYGALALLIIGGLLGLFGSFLIGRLGKSLLAFGGLLAIVSPIVFAAGLSSKGVPLFGSIGPVSYFLSAGFFLAFIAGILMFISMLRHPKEAEAVTPPQPQ